MIKLVKEKEVIKEEVEVNFGTYYFEDDADYCKIELSDLEDGYVKHRLTRVQDYSNLYGVRVYEGESELGEDVPYAFKKFIFGAKEKEITEQEYEQLKQEVINRIK